MTAGFVADLARLGVCLCIIQLSGNSQYDTIAIKQVNANTLTDTRKKTDGKYEATSRYVVSNDGKTMTMTLKGTNAEGKDVTAVFVFEKQ